MVRLSGICRLLPTLRWAASWLPGLEIPGMEDVIMEKKETVTSSRVVSGDGPYLATLRILISGMGDPCSK